ncbi:MAG TPA: ABC transporter ATP-binding protein [Flavobacteriales bacterium]
MDIRLEHIAKHFGNEVVVRGVDLTLPSGSRTALLGPNGSGKSTLLQLIAGALAPTEGRVVHTRNGAVIDPERVYRHISIAAPYLNLYDDLSLRGTIANHIAFKPLRNGIGIAELARTAWLEEHLGKPVRNLSSGMRQRLKLALAICSDTSLLLLDEPTSNLDAKGIVWYGDLLQQHVEGRTLVVASNNEAAETALCGATVEVMSFK